MSKSAKNWLLPPSLRKGELEMNTLIIWILLLIFLILVVVIIIKVKGSGSEEVGGLCSKTGGLFGC